MAKLMKLTLGALLMAAASTAVMGQVPVVEAGQGRTLAHHVPGRLDYRGLHR